MQRFILVLMGLWVDYHLAKVSLIGPLLHVASLPELTSFWQAELRSAPYKVILGSRLTEQLWATL